MPSYDAITFFHADRLSREGMRKKGSLSVCQSERKILTGSDPLLSQGDKKLDVRGLTICITVAFRAGLLATTSYQNRCFNQQDDSPGSCRFAEILIPKESESLGAYHCLLETCPIGPLH